MQKFFNGWNFFRVFRFLAGLALVSYGYTKGDWLLAGLGAMFSFMAMANTACGPFARDCKVEYKETKEDGAGGDH